MRIIFLRCISTLVALLMMSGLQAATITWNLNGVTFDDGGAASGSFGFDATASTFSNINVTTSGGSISGDSYSTIDPLTSFNGIFAFLTDNFPGQTNETAVAFFLSGLMTDAGGSILLSVPMGGEFLCINEDPCSSNNITLRTFSGGSITAVPVPAAVWLFGSALAMLGWIRRKKAS